MTYEQSVSFLYDLQFFGIKLGLENVKRFFEHAECLTFKQKLVHIAGTNGKGSTATMVASIAGAHGLNVGVYTSPHILDFRERIRVSGNMISEDAVVSFVQTYKSYILEHKLTFFEVTTVMAVHYFISQNVDLIVLETGMGGRLDATNCFIPDVCVITNVSMDHQSYLGDTLEQITSEKCGIIKKNIPVICASQRDVVTCMVREKANELDAPFIHIVQDEMVCEFNQTIYHTSLIGEHQKLNMKTALTACSKLFRIIPEKAKHALTHIKWPGRLETWEKDHRVILDVSHNPEGVEQTVRTLESEYPNEKFIIVYSFLDDKDKQANLTLLQTIAKQFYFYPFENKRLLNQETYESIYPKELSIQQFLDAHKPYRALVIGSHYLLDAFLKDNM